LYLSGSLEYAGLGGDLKYLKGISSFRYFQKIFWDVVWRNNISYATLLAQSGRQPPFNELYLLGGAYSLRGFQMMSVGKRVFSQKRKDALVTAGLSAIEAEKRAWRPFGGTKQLYYTAELEFPLIAEAGIKGVTFYDIGEAEDIISNNNFYSDVGFGLRWFSPIGPLRFEWGFPLNRNPEYHDPMNFEFSIGTPF
jgi:outer membrane protein insertion porin family